VLDMHAQSIVRFVDSKYSYQGCIVLFFL